jgi:hypothetical protein
MVAGFNKLYATDDADSGFCPRLGRRGGACPGIPKYKPGTAEIDCLHPHHGADLIGRRIVALGSAVQVPLPDRASRETRANRAANGVRGTCLPDRRLAGSTLPQSAAPDIVAGAFAGALDGYGDALEYSGPSSRRVTAPMVPELPAVRPLCVF